MKLTLSFVFILAFILSGIFLLSGFTPATGGKESSVISSSVKFKIKNAGFTVDGSFSDLKEKIVFDANNVAGSNIEASISSKTVNTGNGTRDGHLKGEKYFDVAKYPLISLKSTSLSKQATGSYTGRFQLTIRETTKDIVIPFTYTEKDGTGIFNGSFTIDRRDYGVGGSSMIMADNVTIMIEVSTSKK